jgi:hypothetical protein
MTRTRSGGSCASRRAARAARPYTGRAAGPGASPGYVSMTGPFFRKNRAQILALVRHCAQSEGAEHPLERIMEIDDIRGGAMLTTTSIHLARRVAEALRRSYKGELGYRYNRAENLLRANWRREG